MKLGLTIEDGEALCKWRLDHGMTPACGRWKAIAQSALPLVESRLLLTNHDRASDGFQLEPDVVNTHAVALECGDGADVIPLRAHGAGEEPSGVGSQRLPRRSELAA